MKITIPRSRTACLLLGSVLALASPNARTAAEEPAPGRRAPMIEIEARFVRATPEQMAEAIGKKLEGDNKVLLEPQESEKAITALKAAKADFFSHSRAVTKSGRKATIESVRELRYPSDYEPSKDDPTKFIPTGFETKDVGVVLEFGPTVTEKNRNEIALDFVISVVDFLGFVEASAPPRSEPPPPSEESRTVTFDELRESTKAAIPEGAKWDPVMPSQKSTTAATLRSGQTWLFETFAPSGPLLKRGSSGFYLFITARVIAPK